MGKRIEYIDAVKGFAILLVVMGHVDAAIHPDWREILQRSEVGAMFWWKIIYSFHMPLFFFISGFLCRSNGEFSFFIRKVRTLLVPFIAMGTITTVMIGHYGTFTVPWFLRTLFIFICMNYSYDVFNRILKIKYDIARIIYLYGLFYVTYIVFHKWGGYFDPVIDNEHFSHFNFYGFLAGITIQKYASLQKLLDKNWFFSISTIYFITYLTLSLLYKQYLPYGYLAGVFSVWHLFKVEYTNHSIKYFSYLGRHSLDIYLFHTFFLLNITSIGSYIISCVEKTNFEMTNTALTIELLSSFVGALIAISLSIVVSSFISKSKLLAFVFLGKSFSLRQQITE